MATNQRAICYERFPEDPFRDGEVALCARISEHGDPQLVVEIKLPYFPTWQKALMARLCERWPWLPIKEPKREAFTHEMVWPPLRPWNR